MSRSEYECPVCGHGDPNAFMRCHHPGCPDGRDQARFESVRHVVPQTCSDGSTHRWPLLVIIFLLFLIALRVWVS